MPQRPNILGLSGSVTRPSRTTELVRTILEGFGDGAATRLVEFADEAPHLFQALTRPALTGRAAALVTAVEQADLLVVASPVYRASYTGALKHLFDLVDHRAFPSKPVVLAATGGTALHGLVTEHQLRPLLGFLNALTIPTAIYAVEADFTDYRLTSVKVRERIARAVEEAWRQLGRPTQEPIRRPNITLAASA